MAEEITAKGSIRVERRGNYVVLNVFGTFAYLGLGAADDLIDAIDDALAEREAANG